MAFKKWSLTATLTILLVASGAVFPGTASAQTGARGAFGTAPRGGAISAGRWDVAAVPRSDRIGVVSVLARNGAEFENIRGRRPTQEEIKNIARTRLAEIRMNRSNLEFHPQARASNGFKTYLTEGAERVVLLAGHNVDGEFHFADGVSLHLTEIDRLLSANGKQGIYLSCDAQNYVPTSPGALGRLWDSDALKITGTIGDSLSAWNKELPGGPLRLTQNTLDEVQGVINRVARSASRRNKLVAVTVVGATVATGATLYWLAPERKDNRH
jgi:hypothetical protein